MPKAEKEIIFKNMSLRGLEKNHSRNNHLLGIGCDWDNDS